MLDNATDLINILIVRHPTITLTCGRLGAIFYEARYIHSPTEFLTGASDSEANLYEVAEQRVAEARNEERTEAERRVADAHIAMDRRMAEMERRVAEGRLDAE
jgi:hypothetical protein